MKKSASKNPYQYSAMNESQPNIQYITYTKTQFLKKQSEVFKKEKDIALAFSTFKINKKNATEGTYGISMRQNYNSTSYADEGYLFLLVDFEQALPQIYVRSWQPQEWSAEALVKLANFRLNK